MAYERQYYTNGDVLDARQMNHMETGIKENSDNISKLSEDIADLKENGTGTGSGATTAQANSLWAFLKKTTFAEPLTDAEINEFKTTWGITEEVEPDTPTTYTITRNLTNCTSSSEVTSISEGSAHTETITANNSYTLTGATISVTMGGSDITSSYSNGVLNISSVTGNIVITVSAVKETTEPDNPEVTLTSISATYTGGEVIVGTALSDLIGITVTATYSDGSTTNVIDYTLSGEIVEGENTITVTYDGLTTTFTVTGVAESSGEDIEPLYALETASNVSLPDRYGVKPIEYSVSNRNHVEISTGDETSGSLYMDVNFSSATTNGIELSSAPEWFKIPAGAEVTFKLTNVNFAGVSSTIPNMHFGLRETGSSKTGQEYILKVLASENMSLGLNFVINETWEKTAIIEDETSVSGICGDFNALPNINLQFDVELYVNDVRWI